MMSLSQKRYGFEHAKRNVKHLSSRPSKLDEDTIIAAAKYFTSTHDNELSCLGMSILLTGRSLQLLLSESVSFEVDSNDYGYLSSPWRFQSTVVPPDWKREFLSSGDKCDVIIPPPFARVLGKIRDSGTSFSDLEKQLKSLLSEISPPHQTITLRRLENVIRSEGNRFNLDAFELDLLQATEKDIHMQHYYVNFETADVMAKHLNFVNWITQSQSPSTILRTGSRFGSKFALNQSGVQKVFSLILGRLEDSIEINRPQPIFTWYTVYVLQFLQLVTLHRPCDRAFGRLDQFTDKFDHLYITDKGPNSKRVIPLGSTGKNIVSEYVHFLSTLSSAISLRSPAVAKSIQEILTSQRTLFHIWRGNDFSPMTTLNLKNLLRDEFPVPLNWHRHTIATELVRRDICRDKIAAYMGHHRPLEHTYAPYSNASYKWLYEIRDAIEAVVDHFSVPLIYASQVLQ